MVVAVPAEEAVVVVAVIEVVQVCAKRGDDNGDVDDGRSVRVSLQKSQPAMTGRGTAERCERRLGSRPEVLTEEEEG